MTARNEKATRRMLTTEEAAQVGGRNRFADVDLDAWLDARRVDVRNRASAPATARSTRRRARR